MTNGKQVLIVDDDTTLVEVLSEYLQSNEEFTTTKTGSGAAALKLSAEEDYAAIILDVSLPDMDGRKACLMMRHNGVRSPIIMLAGGDMDGDTILNHIFIKV